MIQAVLFDMDGLIFDTESVYKKSWQYAAREQELSISDDFYQHFIGVQDPECERMLVEHFPNHFDLERFRQVRDKHFSKLRANGIAMKPGFAPLFTAIKEKGLATAIVTSSHLPEVKHNFAATSYLPKFDLVITAEDVERGKPHPDCYQMAYQRLGYKDKECMVLEDSNNGIRSALAAGCQAVMIPDLLPPSPELVERTTILRSLDEVISLLP
ncbi:HAD-IA family hydrolase [Vibrio astriarenae]|uniref:HAD-IA family hydrolase n=1 Tax=Vibrio astriarenae TaxID=1481923 RepID=A0A7Z2T512_9VIBR|nr:HAD family phosphatase [Vibrio astriarenae]QIA64282.1 HAD-IA family hydrolase [Vibrio astriarenae]